MNFSEEFTANNQVVEIANKIGPCIARSVLEQAENVGGEKALKWLNFKGKNFILSSSLALTVAMGIGAGAAIVAPKIKARIDRRKNSPSTKPADNEADEETSTQNV